MSGLTVEYQLKTENKIKYTIHIANFARHIKTFRVGREIRSRVFMIGESSFQIQIYPSGNSKDAKDDVSLFLKNMSDWRVNAEVSYTMVGNNEKYLVENHCYQSSGSDGDGFGYPCFVKKSRCSNGDLLSDGTFSLVANIEVFNEEVTPGRDIRRPDQEHVRELSSTVQELKDIVEDTKAGQLKELKEEIERMRQSLRGITTNARQSQTSRNLGVQCPVCFDDARPPMRLMQCGEGHIICDCCFTKAREEASAQRRAHVCDREGNPEVDLCHSCRGRITGRPTQLEKILGLC